MSDRETVKYTLGPLRPRPTFWVALGLAILLLFAIPGAIKDYGVVTGVLAVLFWVAICLVWAYSSIKPYLTVRQWARVGEYEQRDWSPAERGLQRGKMLVHLYEAGKGDSNARVPLEMLRQVGDWTLVELYNLLNPLDETGIVEVEMRDTTDDQVGRVMAFAEAKIRLTPTGVLATEDAVTLARQRPGYSVTIHGNDNQVQVATVNSEQLRDT